MDATKKKDSASKKEDTVATQAAAETSPDAKKSPLWSDESDSKRVRASIWRHENKSGKVRYTVAICRSYYDQQEAHWVNTHFYDRQDLDDVIAFAEEAKKKLARMIDGETA